ncbi:hypothetical protein [Pseudomonas lundensis]|jgi:hypothetical protein|uniref:hypothetical protein n=1 Tax=Pseudomonas lundensis TaxID=86185 RepID=UPI00193BEBA5|nr:hypothetical protein [Pseudomonas lundensis]MBM1183727.1 hypothetical protein [Pseudomonas lundensis]
MDDLPLLGTLLTRTLDGFDGKEPAPAGFLLSEFHAMLKPHSHNPAGSKSWTTHLLAISER